MNGEPRTKYDTPAATATPGMTVALEGDGASIAHARHLAVAFLARTATEEGLEVTDRVMGNIQLVVSELVTNARKYAPGPIRMQVRVADGAVEIGVWDSDPVTPVPRAADPQRVGQHGLEIVEAVAEQLTVRREDAGKWVAARVLLSEGHDAARRPGPDDGPPPRR